jgi:hypothetical protein
MTKTLIASAALAALLAAPAHAVTLVAWNFNSAVADGNVATGTTMPSIGVGTAALQGTNATFATGSPTDTPVDNSGWNTTSYPAQGTGDKTEGAAFFFSTVGYTGIQFSWEHRHSNTSSKYGMVQYTLNGGAAWADAPIGLVLAIGGDTWHSRSIDLTSVAGADNNANFGVRVVSTFRPGTMAYDASNPASTYSANGTWRFDGVTVMAAPIPEPGTIALMLAGLAAVGFVANRRRHG